MAEFITQVRTSRKHRRCERCHGRIQPGDAYTRYSAPPGGELGNVGWWHLTEHPKGECPEVVTRG